MQAPKGSVTQIVDTAMVVCSSSAPPRRCYQVRDCREFFWVPEELLEPGVVCALWGARRRPCDITAARYAHGGDRVLGHSGLVFDVKFYPFSLPGPDIPQSSAGPQFGAVAQNRARTRVAPSPNVAFTPPAVPVSGDELLRLPYTFVSAWFKDWCAECRPVTGAAAIVQPASKGSLVSLRVAIEGLLAQLRTLCDVGRFRRPGWCTPPSFDSSKCYVHLAGESTDLRIDVVEVDSSVAAYVKTRWGAFLAGFMGVSGYVLRVEDGGITRVAAGRLKVASSAASNAIQNQDPCAAGQLALPSTGLSKFHMSCGVPSHLAPCSDLWLCTPDWKDELSSRLQGGCTFSPRVCVCRGFDEHLPDRSVLEREVARVIGFRYCGAGAIY
eukprot:SAG11_NODE_899_length_6643_cov_55.347048_4_plen_383_part_00